MEVSDQAVLVGLAVLLLAIHVAASVLVLRTLRSASHHLARLEELAEMEKVLVRRGTRRGTGYPSAAALPKVSFFGASATLKDMLKEKE